MSKDIITDGFCFICKKPTQNLSLNPENWRIDLPLHGGNGLKRSYHQGCIVNKIKELEQQKVELLELLTECYKRFKDYEMDVDTDRPIHHIQFMKKLQKYFIIGGEW